ncbi:MAG: hypothetical protein KKF41_04335 [Actinobacteria bacterium]|nr:hypothetical protein [Actinomycetota bacterium]MBU1943438.1 hypothetical protein [Actinomycetota bacterium]MBU2686795.1 hypothetical protein [Actinomycetota bacterium]
MRRFFAFAMALTAAALLAAAGCGGPTTLRVALRSDTRFSLSGISALEDGSAFAVGEDGVVLRMEPGGAWREEPAATSHDLVGVFALDAAHVWAVGSAGTILFYDGTSWMPQDSGTEVELTGVTATDPDHAWACGWGEEVLFFDGERWTRQHQGMASLRGIAAADPDHVWAVGSNGTILFYDGGSWSRQDSETTVELTGVCVGDGGAWACGLAGRLLEFRGAWRTVRSGDEMFRGIARSGDGTLWVVGYQDFTFSTDPGSVVLRLDGGWMGLEVPEGLYPTGVSTSGGGVWVCGLGGVVWGEAL